MLSYMEGRLLYSQVAPMSRHQVAATFCEIATNVAGGSISLAYFGNNSIYATVI